MASLTHYYTRAKTGMANINPQDMAELGEDFLITGATGLALGLVSASIGGLEKKVAGFNVPVDGLASLALGAAALSMRSKGLRVAAIAAGGSASTRTFESFFKKALGAHGEFDNGAGIPQMGSGTPGYNYGYGWGGERQGDPLMRLAETL